MSSRQRTVLVTGSSSGIGRACVAAFAHAGWNVVATMRTPGEHASLEQSTSVNRGTVVLARLDVTDAGTIDAAFAAGIERFGAIDCVVNNAGYAVSGVFEEFDGDQVRRQFDTNVFGVMRVCRAAIAHMRPRRAGTIVNVSSMGGRITFPLYSVYHASKFAVEGFSESLQYELEPFGIRVRIVEPGPVDTDFYGRSMEREPAEEIPDYNPTSALWMGTLDAAGANGTSPERIARVIVRAAGSRSHRLRWSTDATGRSLMIAGRLLPHAAFRALVRRTVTSGYARR